MVSEILRGPQEKSRYNVFCRVSGEVKRKFVIKTGILPIRERISSECATKLRHARECDCNVYALTHSGRILLLILLLYIYLNVY